MEMIIFRCCSPLEAVDGHLESCSQVYLRILSPYCVIDQSTDTTAQKKPSPLKEEKYAMKRR